MRRSVLMNLALLCVKADLALEHAKMRSALRLARVEMGQYSPHLLRDMGLDESSVGQELACRQRESLRLVCRSRQRHRWPRQG